MLTYKTTRRSEIDTIWKIHLWSRFGM